MSSNTSPNPPPTPVDPAPQSGHAPRDFAQLAKRISSRTTDLLALALIAALLLSVGVQLTRWWRTEPAQVSTNALASTPLAVWDDPAGLSLEFTTDGWSLRRDSVAGNTDDVTAIATERLARVVNESVPASYPPIDDVEQQWLDRLPNESPPSMENHDGIFVLGGPWPWVVATVKSGNNERRIAGWAFALPQTPDLWTLYVAQRADAAQVHNPAEDDIPLPASAMRVMSVDSATGGFLTFHCNSSARACRDDWHRQLTSAGWTRSGDWTFSDHQSRATYARTVESGPQRLDLLLREQTGGAIAGACDWSRSPAANATP